MTTDPGFASPAAPSPTTGPSAIDLPTGTTAAPAGLAGVDTTDEPAATEPVVKAPAAAARHGVGDVVTYEDFDYVTNRTTVRHAIVVGADEDVTVSTDGQDETVPALTVVFLGEGVTLPAHAFED